MQVTHESESKQEKTVRGAATRSNQGKEVNGKQGEKGQEEGKRQGGRCCESNQVQSRRKGRRRDTENEEGGRKEARANELPKDPSQGLGKTGWKKKTNLGRVPGPSRAVKMLRSQPDGWDRSFTQCLPTSMNPGEAGAVGSESPHLYHNAKTAMSDTTTATAKPRLSVRAHVRVRCGVLDPDYPDLSIEGWAGTIVRTNVDSMTPCRSAGVVIPGTCESNRAIAKERGWLGVRGNVAGRR